MKKEVYEIAADQLNKNGRIYSIDVLEKAVERYNNIESVAFGELGYQESEIVSLHNVSHVINNAFLKKERIPRKKKKQLKKTGKWIPLKKKMMVEVEFLDTINGKKAKELIDLDIDFDIGMRAVGSVVEGVVQEGLKITSFDIIMK
jgi:hypothetical protein